MGSSLQRQQHGSEPGASDLGFDGAAASCVLLGESGFPSEPEFSHLGKYRPALRELTFSEGGLFHPAMEPDHKGF